MPCSFTDQRSHYMPVRMPQTLDSTRSALNFFQRHVCSPIPLNPSRVRVCESLDGFSSRSSQLEQLLLNCSNPRQWSCRSIRSSRHPSEPVPGVKECIEDAVYDGVLPCRPFSIMCITRRCAQQQMRARGETGVRRREAAPAPLVHA